MKNILFKNLSLLILFLFFMGGFTQCVPSSSSEDYWEKEDRYPRYIRECAPAQDLYVKHDTSFKLLRVKNSKKTYRFFAISFFKEGGYNETLDLINHPNKKVLDYLDSIGDNGYSKEKAGKHFTRAKVLRYPITHISVKGNRDLNENYPAGSELNHLFVVAFKDNYSYIKSGYDPELKEKEIELSASDSNRLKQSLVPDPYMAFYMLEYPRGWSNWGVKLTISISFENGANLKKTFTCFIPAEGDMKVEKWKDKEYEEIRPLTSMF